jgi:hypothetical protein
MEKYKVIHPFYKLSEKKNYIVGDTIELDKEYAESISYFIDFETKGISYKKTIEEADKEIKTANTKKKK